MNRKPSNSKIINTKSRFNIQLHILNKSLHLKVPIPCTMNNLVEFIRKSVPSLSQKIAYLQTVDSNWLLDYKIQNKVGQLKSDCKIRCVLQKKTKEVFSGVSEYSILKCVGVGGFSKVYLVRSKLNGTFYVAKYIEKDKIQDRIQLIINQKTVNECLDFPFLVKMRQFIQIQAFYVMILDYCPGGELFHLQRQLHQLDEQSAKKYFIQVLLAIEYMHSKQIIYRDLKPQNIMLDMEGHIRITDFGLAKISKEKRYSFCGSLEYMSPQVLSRKGYSFQVDYYCLGALLYEMVVGCPPFYESGSPQNQTKFRIMNEQVYFPDDLGLTQNLKNFLKLLLQKDPKKRLGHLAGVKEIKCHPWIGWINLTEYLTKKVQMPHPVDLDCFNFDSKDITDSANRLLYDMKQIQKNQTKQNRLSHTNQTKSKECLYKSPYRQGRDKILQRYKSLTNIQRRCPSQLKNRNKEESLDLKIKRKINSTKEYLKQFNKFQSAKYLYLPNSHQPINLSNFFRCPTEGNQINKNKQKERKSYVRQETESKQNQRKRREGLKKRKAKQQYLFVQVKKI